jgi:hypothetical protein
MEFAGADSSDKQTRSTTAHYGFYYAYIYHIYLFKSINKSFLLTNITLCHNGLVGFMTDIQQMINLTNNSDRDAIKLQ